MTLLHGSMAVGTIQRFELKGNDKHPWHIHVNSFQLSGVTDSTGDANPYYVDGDWHDVFYQPANVEGQYAYFSVDNHQARVTICHNPFSMDSC